LRQGIGDPQGRGWCKPAAAVARDIGPLASVSSQQPSASILALIVETAGRMSSCMLTRGVRRVAACKSRDEFQAFVSDYMEKQMQAK
jgi:hypothetical protein